MHKAIVLQLNSDDTYSEHRVLAVDGLPQYYEGKHRGYLCEVVNTGIYHQNNIPHVQSLAELLHPALDVRPAATRLAPYRGFVTLEGEALALGPVKTDYGSNELALSQYREGVLKDYRHRGQVVAFNESQEQNATSETRLNVFKWVHLTVIGCALVIAIVFAVTILPGMVDDLPFIGDGGAVAGEQPDQHEGVPDAG